MILFFNSVKVFSSEQLGGSLEQAVNKVEISTMMRDMESLNVMSDGFLSYGQLLAKLQWLAFFCTDSSNVLVE